MKYLEVGEVAEINGVKVMCCDDKIGNLVCQEFCALYRKDSCLEMECFTSNREDKKSVYFKKIRK